MAKQTFFFVDSSVLIAHIRKQQSPTQLDKARTVFGKPVASQIVVFELEVGARRAGRIMDFQTHFPAIATYPLTLALLLRAAEIQAQLLKQGQRIEVLDLFIASTALEHDLPLFTLNTAHFQRVPDLKLLTLP